MVVIIKRFRIENEINEKRLTRSTSMETKSNLGNLENFRHSVERVNFGEFAVAAAGSGTAISAAVIATNSAVKDDDLTTDKLNKV